MGRKELARQLSSQGKTKLQIADIMGVNESTVRTYLNDSRYNMQLRRIAEYRVKIKRKAVDYSGGGCLKCSYNKCLAALTFHHLDPSQKELKISSGKSMGWDKIKKEVDKCVLICERCHIEIHNGYGEISGSDWKEQIRIRSAYEDKPLSVY